MEKLEVEGTSKTPAIISDSSTGIIEIKGRSNPENSVEFYRPLVNWIEEYISNPGENTTVNVQLEHFNTSSSKSILDIFKRLEAIQKAERKIVINWYYEADDEEILEAGETYETMTDIPFIMVAY